MTLLVALAFFCGCVTESQSPISVSNASSVDSSKMSDKMIVVFETNKGMIEVELDMKNAPVTSQNFLEYVNEGFFDGTIFHRIIPGFMVQGGGFTADAMQKDTHAPIALETSGGLKNLRGTLAMARTNDPDSATCQFFINLEDNDFLDPASGNPGYAVFGKVSSGMDVVDEIAGVKTSSRGYHKDWPVSDVIIEKAYAKA